MKTVEINGRTFQVINKRDKKALADRVANHKMHYSGTTIWDAYGRPSRTKESIWEDWDEWARNTDEVRYFEVSGAGSHFFSIEAVVNIGEAEGIMTITAYNDRIEI